MAFNVHPTPAGAVHLLVVPLGLAIRSPNRPLKEVSLLVLPSAAQRLLALSSAPPCRFRPFRPPKAGRPRARPL